MDFARVVTAHTEMNDGVPTHYNAGSNRTMLDISCATAKVNSDDTA